MSRISFTEVKGNSMRLDGGAMFGNAPKALWEKWAVPDHRNMIEIPTQALLVRTESEAILFETGAGAYMSPAMKERFQVEEDSHVLLGSLAAHGLDHRDITHVVLSHLHFDHAGGLLSEWDADHQALELLFPNARIITGEKNYIRSGAPHARDRASFIPGLYDLLGKSGQLELKNGGDCLKFKDLDISFIESQGHTPGMLVSWIRSKELDIIFTADVIPARPWVNPAITMGYDRFPEKLLEEKSALLEKAFDARAILFYPHDRAASGLRMDENRPRMIADQGMHNLNVAV